MLSRRDEQTLSQIAAHFGDEAGSECPASEQAAGGWTGYDIKAKLEDYGARWRNQLMPAHEVGVAPRRRFRDLRRPTPISATPAADVAVPAKLPSETRKRLAKLLAGVNAATVVTLIVTVLVILVVAMSALAPARSTGQIPAQLPTVQPHGSPILPPARGRP
jgi:hypothetical protein